VKNIKEALFLVLLFVGISLGAMFIFATVIGLLKISTEMVVEKGITYSFLLGFVVTAFVGIKRSQHIRYWIAVLVFLGGIIGTVLFAGGTLFALLDIPSLLIMGIVPFLFAGILCGFKEMMRAFSIQAKNDYETATLQKALRCITMYGKTLWLTCGISVIINIIYYLQKLGDTAAIGPGFAWVLVSVFYGCVIHVIIVIPAMMVIRGKLDE